MASPHSYGQITEPGRPLNKDALSMVPRRRAADAAHEALFPVQSKPPEVMVAGVALLFATLAARCGLDPEELHALGRKLLRDPEEQLGGDRGTNSSLQSLRDFAGIRIMGERHVSIA